MKVLIVLSALVAVCLAKPGYLSLSVPADTPEVAAAKAAHFAAYNAAAARSAGVVAVAPSYGYAAYGPANIVIGADGVPLDTPEVAARKAADAVAHARAAAGLPAVGPVPAAVVPAVVGSVPADTPEVVAAKAAHAAAHVEATVRNAAEAVGIRGLYGVVPSVYSYGVVPGAYSVHYDGTLLTPDGVPLDTPAVAAGKVANAVAHIQAKSGLIV